MLPLDAAAASMLLAVMLREFKLVRNARAGDRKNLEAAKAYLAENKARQDVRTRLLRAATRAVEYHHSKSEYERARGRLLNAKVKLAKQPREE